MCNYCFPNFTKIIGLSKMFSVMCKCYEYLFYKIGFKNIVISSPPFVNGELFKNIVSRRSQVETGKGYRKANNE